MQLIGLTGRAGAGKDTFAQVFSQIYAPAADVLITSFADPLKHYCMIKFGLTHEDCYTHEGKARYIPWLGCTVRELLQKEGTEHTKPFWGEDFWVRRMERTFRDKGADVIIIPDVRFDAEAQWIRDNDGVVIHIHRDFENSVTQDHVSERGISPKLVDLHFVHGTLEETPARVREFIKELGRGN